MKGKEIKHYRLGVHIDSDQGDLTIYYYVKGKAEGLTKELELASLLAEDELSLAEEAIKKHYPEATPCSTPNLPVGSIWEFPQ